MRDQKTATPRVLVDLVLAHKSFGFSGIPQDARLLFDCLGDSRALSVDGLVYRRFGKKSRGKMKSLLAQSIFLGVALGDSEDLSDWKAFYEDFPQSLLDSVVESVFGKREKVVKTRRELQDIVWRELFAGTIEPSRKPSFDSRQLWLSGLTLKSMSEAALKSRRPPNLDTREFDFVVFQDSRAVNLQPKSQKVIRYHDGIPLLASDTQKSKWGTRLHEKSIKACANNSLFVCNSDSARIDLEIISPKAADRAEVIPYFVPKMEKADASAEILSDIAVMRVSESTFDSRLNTKKSDLVSKWFRGSEAGSKSLQFLMTLSTIEPRKNIKSLISAWQHLREGNAELRLLIIGKPGWEYEETLRAMRPFIERGYLLHLENVGQTELKYFYSAAACFVFPSFYEGFGLPPAEAMQSGCPVVVSDIPAHRYMAGDAALFADPYSSTDLADKIALALRPEIAAELREKGYKNTQRFTVETVLPLWESFFERHMDLRNRSK